MAIRLALAPAVALSLLSTVSFASAQYYPAQSTDQGSYQQQDPAAAAQQQQMPAPQVPAAYDPYGNGAGAGGQAAAPQAQGQPAYAQPQQQASAPAGYPAGAYSGQPPAGMSSPYGTTASQGYPAQQQAPAYPAQQQAAYGAPQPVGAVPPAGMGQSAAEGAHGSSVAMLPPEDQPEEGTPEPLRPDLQKQLVDYTGKEAPGTIIIDTPNTHLYLVMPGGKAMRYGIGVGRDGFTWAGTEKITAKKEWADWRPPAEMIERQPYLPRFMAGGPGNPLGARTMYLGATVYRIHGTNQPSTIGKFMSSGCIRMLNEDVEDLYDRVKLGTKVVVLPAADPQKTASVSPSAQPQPIPVSAPASSAVR